MAKLAFRRIWIIFFPSSKTSSLVLPHMVNGRTVIPALRQPVPGENLLRVRAGCGLYSAAKEIKKNQKHIDNMICGLSLGCL